MRLPQILAVAALAVALAPGCLCRTLRMETLTAGQPVDAPGPCCTPDQFEVYQTIIFAGGQPTTTCYGGIAFDLTNQFLAQNLTYTTADGKTFGQRALIDGNSGTMYMVDINTKKCTIGSTTKISGVCVPPTFNYTTTVALGDSSQQFNGLVFQDGGGSVVSNVLVMTQSQCAPVSLATIGATQVQFVSFFNFTVGIKDRGVFQVPPECKSAAVELEDTLATRMRSSVGSATYCVLFGQC